MSDEEQQGDGLLTESERRNKVIDTWSIGQEPADLAADASVTTED